MYKHEDFVKLCVRERANGRIVWLSCLKSTAAFYGWDKTFPTVLSVLASRSIDGYLFDPGRLGPAAGPGREHRICRVSSTHGWPAGKTNAFRVSRAASTRDLARIAQATQVDWEWMTCQSGSRRSRGSWEKAAAAISSPSRRAQAAG